MCGYLSEPLAEADLHTLTKKTLLLSLATAKRLVELQALSCRILFQGNDVVLSS